MNRHERRKAASQARHDEPKAKITFHQAPEDFSAEHIAMFMAALIQTFTVSQKAFPGSQKPVHVTVEYDGKKLCGTAEPSDGEGDTQVSKEHLS